MLTPSKLAGSPAFREADDSGKADAWLTFRVWLLVLSTFFPFLGVGFGNSTNIPLSAFASLLLIFAAFRKPSVFIVFVLAATAPSAMAFVQTLMGGAVTNPVSLAVWPFHILPFFGFAAIAMRRPVSLINPIRFGLAIAAGYSFVQKFFLDAGIIPFLEYYDLPGYASVQNNAESITRYIRRPFGFFPEPSFMAGSLALATIALLLLRRRHKAALSRSDLALTGLALTAIYLSDSGSALVSIGLVLLAAVWPLVRGARRFVLSVGVVGVSVWLGSNVLDSRGISQNFSWSDRLASIIGALRYSVSDSSVAVFGAGKGAATGLFQRGLIPLEGLQYFTALPDVFSVIVRMILELGFVLGLGIVIALVAFIFMISRAQSGSVVAVGCAVLWLLVAGLTISYESAAWIWALPGVCFGIFMSQSHEKYRSLNNGRAVT